MRPFHAYRSFTVRLFVLLGSAVGACRCAPATTTPPPDSPARSVPVSSDSAASDGVTCPAILTATRSLGSRPNSYVVPTDSERQAARTAIQSVLQGRPADVAAFGFESVAVPEWPGVTLLRERNDRKRGGGAYLVRSGSASNFVVQAPHTFYDEGTFPLACELFQRSQARALFVNTSHRYKSAPETRDGEHPADVAHAPDSLFLAMTEGLVAALPSVDVVQLHGFQNREAEARAVVSAGERRPGNPLVARVRSNLEAAVGPRILAYPEETNELGATTNVEGMVVRRGGGRFIHIEMDGGLRRALNGDAALRGTAFDALLASFR